MVKVFDAAFVEAAVERLGVLDEDTAPEWGVMRPRQVVGHLTTVVRYSMNKEALTPNEGGFMIRYIAKPLIFRGVIRIPKGARKPRFYQEVEADGMPEALRAESLEFVRHCEARTLQPPAHPIFGPLRLEEWSQLHRIHFDHHLRQFGISL